MKTQIATAKELAETKAELAEVLAENASFIKLFEKLSQDDEKVRIIGVLNKALQFYADPGTYFAIFMMPDPPCGEFINDLSDDHGHRELDGDRYGKTARAALREAFGDLWDEKS